MHQVVGFLAVGVAGMALLRGWDLSKFVSYGFLLLSVFGAALVGSSETVRPDGPSQMPLANATKGMPATAGQIAPIRPSKPRIEASAAW
ncbi:hypothetical protein D8770_08980 [Methylobacterium sp. DB1607]|nr:hypothetical protein [Methylobacterium sp. DB1607]